MILPLLNTFPKPTPSGIVASLGGARPKASVRDEAGTLCIAEFPSRNDTRDMGGWELVAHSLASKAGIVVPDAKPLRFPESAYTTFLVKRFDRTPKGSRLAFISAMTLTQHTDGEAGASYLELVDLLQSRGADTQADRGFGGCCSTFLFTTQTITFAITGFGES
jgi:serine/threonine-protein kinase HipA